LSVLFTAFCSEVLSRYFSTRRNNRKLINSVFFVGIAYTIIRPFSFLREIIKPKKKIFTNSEKDILRFVRNLAIENTLEKKEAKLVEAALKFDDLMIKSIIVPKNKTVFLDEDMTNEDIMKVHMHHFFTRYPVLNKKKELIGIFNTKTYF
jgi:CBS domain containing-hemolysin-like protein